MVIPNLKFSKMGGIPESTLVIPNLKFSKMGGYSRVNFGHLKSEVFRKGGWGGYSGVNFGHPKSEVFRNGGGYSGVNFDHPKSEVFGCVFYSYFLTSWNIEAFSLCVFTSTKSPRGPPWNEGHRPKVHHETSVLEVPAQEQHEHSFYSSSTNTFITCSLYTVRRYRTSPGAPDLRARLG